MSPSNSPRPTKSERTAAAREKARLIREEQLKKEKRNKLLVRWGVVVALVAVIAIVAIVITTTMRQNAPIADSGPSPANMNSNGGITLTKGNSVAAAPAANVNVASVPTPSVQPTQGQAANAPGIEAAPKGQPAKVVVYVDFICPICNQFEQTYGQKLTDLRNAGQITLEYRPIAFLDRNSTTNYSSRAAAAAACVANSNPDKYADFFAELYKQQPAEGSAGLSDQKLKDIASGLGADISKCVDDKTYRPWVKYATQLALSSGVSGTPTAIVDGKQWGLADSQNQGFDAFLQADLDARAKA
ncbi:thioredoxin domain-containing protein [Sinomonas sp. JGH33]|uniref:Thioredoxin domain-containing protein n=1 Tax=Sinomonas terricola TaxID=3110330 RepID=A0ABU5TBN6_9MICC|nr:thioredoxin domain-containing protein [Sinomonas sp. JGH33]MEA5457089.1 thioredoxin domain-containing protein [Sinomonas sp. JGH33]